jgi:hypothetical protein
MSQKDRRWTEEDVRRLRLFADGKVSAVYIAKSIARSVASVRRKALRLNLPVVQRSKRLVEIGLKVRGKRAAKREAPIPAFPPLSERHFEAARRKRLLPIMNINRRRFMKIWNACGKND